MTTIATFMVTFRKGLNGDKLIELSASSIDLFKLSKELKLSYDNLIFIEGTTVLSKNILYYPHCNTDIFIVENIPLPELVLQYSNDRKVQVVKNNVVVAKYKDKTYTYDCCVLEIEDELLLFNILIDEDGITRLYVSSQIESLYQENSYTVRICSDIDNNYCILQTPSRIVCFDKYNLQNRIFIDSPLLYSSFITTIIIRNNFLILCSYHEGIRVYDINTCKFIRTDYDIGSKIKKIAMINNEFGILVVKKYNDNNCIFDMLLYNIITGEINELTLPDIYTYNLYIEEVCKNTAKIVISENTKLWFTIDLKNRIVYI
jgi:hypothetical protein